MSTNVLLISFIFFLCSCSIFTNVSCYDLHNSIYESFLQCLPLELTQPDSTCSTFVHSPVANSSSYTSVLQAYIQNNRFNTRKTPKPGVIITPTKESHVQAAVICAKKNDVQIKIRSGGHDFEGISYVAYGKQFIVLDMSNFRMVDVDIATETVVVQTGAQLGELYYRIWEKSKLHGFPAGLGPTVGIGGHISSGGHGFMLRKYGLSVDHVIDAQIVDVHGQILNRNSMGEDLFWAIRGGGGDSFCVILSYTVKLVPVPKINTVFQITKTIEENAIDCVYKWQSIGPAVNNDLFIRVYLQPVTVINRKTVQARFKAHFMGDSERLLVIMNEKFPELGLKKEDCTEVTWIQSVLFWANIDYNNNSLVVETLLNRNSDNVSFFKRKSDYVQTPISKQGMKSLFNKMVEIGDVGFVLTPHGGRMSEVASDATPYPHRAGNLYKMDYVVEWNNEDSKLEEKCLNKIRAMFKDMKKYVSKNPRGAVLGYRDLDIGMNNGDGFNSGKVYGKKYFKENFDRLVKVKTSIDPDDFFKSEQSIPSLYRKTKGMSRIHEQDYGHYWHNARTGLLTRLGWPRPTPTFCKLHKY